MLKIIFLTNNKVSLPLFTWLKKEGNNVLLFEKKLTYKDIKSIKPDFLISYNYRYIIPKEIIDLFPKKLINLHISLLPWNRGAHPNIWSFIDNTPKGVTIHLIDEGIDTGDILLQKEVYIDEKKHTLQSSYNLLHTEIQNLFIKNWDKIKNLEIEPKPQKGKGTIHYKKDFEKIKHLLGNKGWNMPILEFKEKVYEWRKYHEDR